MKYGSVCSGIEAASAAWEPLGWKPAWFAEIEKFPSAVLAHHYPEVPNHGDFTLIRKAEHPADKDIDLLVGGTPCFPAGARVATAEGFKSIEAVRVGDCVLTHKGRFQPVLRVGSKLAATVEVKGQGHPGVVTTPEHPFYARKKSHRSTRVGGKAVVAKSISAPDWVKAEDLPGNHWGCVAAWPEMELPEIECAGRETSTFNLTPALFVLVGAYLGDGWVRINERRGYVLFGLNAAKLEALRPYLDQMGAYQVAEMRTGYRVAIASRPFARWLVEHFGVGSGGKSIPMWALGMQKDLREALLFGYQATDGHTDAKGVGKITTVSRQLALTTRMLANSLGYASSVLFCSRPPTCVIERRTVNQRDTYAISISASTRSSFEDQGYRWQCVRSVASTNNHEIVYNLEVEGDNSYVIDGIAVHNCQSFSISGLRGGLDDDRGQLALEFMRLAGALRPRWIVWENVPGALSSGGGRDFGSILGALAELGYGFAYRVLDAQYVRVADRFPHAVPQRRRRVFVVGYLGDWRPASAVLFEPESLRGYSTPSRGAGEDNTGSTGDGLARCLTAGEMKRLDWETCNFVSTSFGGRAESATAGTLRRARIGDDTLSCPQAFDWQTGGDMRGMSLQDVPQLQRCQTPAILLPSSVRRLTPVECERLQGFPDGYTDIRLKGKQTPDGPRYKALGNSMAVNVMSWIGARINLVDGLIQR